MDLIFQKSLFQPQWTDLVFLVHSQYIFLKIFQRYVFEHNAGTCVYHWIFMSWDVIYQNYLNIQNYNSYKKDRSNGVVRFIFPQELWCFESFNIQSDKKPIENIIFHCGIMIYVKYPTSTVVKNNLWIVKMLGYVHSK